MVNADSLLATKGFVDDNMFQLKPEDSLVETREYNSGASMTRKYVTTRKPDDTYPDTSYYYFTTDPRISSLGKVDIEGRSGRMRLRKVSFVYRPVTIEGLDVPLRTLTIEHGVLDQIPEDTLRKILKQHFVETPQR